MIVTLMYLAVYNYHIHEGYSTMGDDICAGRNIHKFLLTRIPQSSRGGAKRVLAGAQAPAEFF